MNKRNQEYQNKLQNDQVALSMLNEMSEMENLKNRLKKNEKREKEKNVMFDNQ